MNKATCPRCGAAAHTTSKQSYGSNSLDLSLVCSNPSCGSEFSGAMTLTLKTNPSVQHFTQQPVIQTDC